MKKIMERLSRLYLSLNKVLEKNCIIGYWKSPKTSEIGCDIFCFLFTDKICCLQKPDFISIILMWLIYTVDIMICCPVVI